MLSTDDMSISKGLLYAHILPCHFQIGSTLIYLKPSYVVPLDNCVVLFNSMPHWIQPPDKLSKQYGEKTHKPGCTATEDSVEILHVRSAGNVLCML